MFNAQKIRVDIGWWSQNSRLLDEQDGKACEETSTVDVSVASEFDGVSWRACTLDETEDLPLLQRLISKDVKTLQLGWSLLKRAEALQESGPYTGGQTYLLICLIYRLTVCRSNEKLFCWPVPIVRSSVFGRIQAVWYLHSVTALLSKNWSIWSTDYRMSC